MTRERGSLAESKNCEILLFPTADRRFGTNAPPGGPHFRSNSPLYGAERESNARGLPGGKGMGGFGIDWYIKFEAQDFASEVSNKHAFKI